ncbi:MAG: DNA polymerase III subunit gamma/tau, partial [Phycisphaerae bacterium]
MSYTVLARKFRSQTFDEVVGQEAVTTTLKNAITQGRVHHGYLFCGTRGVGKTSMARILAKALNCLEADGAT